MMSIDNPQLHHLGEIILFFPDGHKEHMALGAPTRGMVRGGKRYTSYILRVIKRTTEDIDNQILDWLNDVNMGLEELCP